MLSVSYLTVFAKMLQCHQMPMKSQEMTKFRYYLVTLILAFNGLLEEFIKHRYRVSDIALRELSPAFITDFELFLRTEKNHCTNTVWSYMMPFRSIIYTAINNGWLQRDPFSEQSSSHASRVLIRKNLHISRSHR